MAISVAQWLKKNAASLRDKDIETARLDCLLMLEHVTNRKRAYILAHEDDELTDKQLKQLGEFMDSRLIRQPMAYILKSKQFYHHTFHVDERVLIPRSTSEPIVDWCIDNAAQGASCIDIGTGSGCLAISIKLARRDVKMTASDISAEAVEVAEQNAKLLEADVSFKKMDLLDGDTDKYDVYIANLPYVPVNYHVSEEVHKEPSVAIYSKTDGLEHYRRLAKQLAKRDIAGSKLIIEHNPEQFEQLKQTFSEVYEHALSVSNYTTVFSN